MAQLRGPEQVGREFDAAMVAELPEPARRYLNYAIRPGTPLRYLAEIEFSGHVRFRMSETTEYLEMRGAQLMRPGEFVCQTHAGGADISLSGADGRLGGRAWSHLWFCGLLPLVRRHGRADLARSAAGRAVAQSLLWLPAALLPSDRVRWEAVDRNTARAVVSLGGHDHVLEVRVSADGRPTAFSLMRWTREGGRGPWGLRACRGWIGSTLDADGYRVAAEVTGDEWLAMHGEFTSCRIQVRRILFE